MLRRKINLFTVVLLLSSNCFSAVSTEDEKLIEELSGKSKTIPVKSPVTAVSPVTKNKSDVAPTTISEKHLFAGLDAFKVKNYILALKHYNTIILKYSKSKEVKSAYLAKYKLYTEMGLKEQADQNLQIALQSGNKNIK